MRDWDCIVTDYKDQFCNSMRSFAHIGKFGKHNNMLRRMSTIMINHLYDTLNDLKNSIVRADEIVSATKEGILNKKNDLSTKDAEIIISSIKEISMICRAGQRIAHTMDIYFDIHNPHYSFMALWGRVKEALITNNGHLLWEAKCTLCQLNHDIPSDWEDTCNDIRRYPY